MSTYNRSESTMGSMAIAMGIIVGILLIMALVVNWRSEEHIPSVDYRPDAEMLAETADFTAYAPEGLPEGWVPTSTDLSTEEPVTWKLGFATPDDRHAELLIGEEEPEAMVEKATGGGERDGSSQVGGEEWERYLDGTGTRHALVKRGEDATVVLTGGSGYEELEVLAGSLQEV
ncbi:DUF4245 domain-containing protein [Nocardiopsis potens]|uniref:DUF4245 domain-containing protein n=1 Tax=Nocardiopsis potens TaxID=1246458 RepID=UPI000477D177|nr:DUF4245 domain-containing protein [Nocardiopsis potens]